jgi:hypothetical protein
LVDTCNGLSTTNRCRFGFGGSGDNFIHKGRLVVKHFLTRPEWSVVDFVAFLCAVVFLIWVGVSAGFSVENWVEKNTVTRAETLFNGAMNCAPSTMTATVSGKS